MTAGENVSCRLHEQAYYRHGSEGKITRRTANSLVSFGLRKSDACLFNCKMRACSTRSGQAESTFGLFWLTAHDDDGIAFEQDVNARASFAPDPARLTHG